MKTPSLHQRFHALVARLAPPSFAKSDDDTRRRARLIVQFSLVIFLCGPVYGAFYFALGMYVSAAGALLCAVSLGLTPWLFRRYDRIAFGAHWVTGTCFVVLAMVTMPTGGLRAPAVSWLALIPVTALMLGGRRAGLLWTVVSIGSVVVYFVVDLLHLTPESEAPLSWVPALRLMVGAGLTGLIALLAWLYEDNKDRTLEELRTASAEVEHARDQYRALVESTRTIPWELDLTVPRVVYVGPQARTLLGAVDWLAPGFLMDRLHPSDKEALLDGLLRASDLQISCDLEFRMRRDDGTWIWLRSIASASSAGPHEVRGILLDITERRELEREVQQAQRLKSVGRMAAGIAHEINTPMQFISDSVSFLQDSQADLIGLLGRYRELRIAATEIRSLHTMSEELSQAEERADVDYLTENVPKAAARAIDGLARVSAIVRSMKEFAGPETMTKGPADLNMAIAATLTIARSEYADYAEIETQLAEIPSVVCDVGQINQVFLNVVTNAAHAIADVVKASGSRGLIKIESRREGPDAVISISDTGGGIPEAIRNQVFDPFFTTKVVGQGTGQGLAVSRAIVVDQHRGSLTFDSEMGRGTTFTIRLPLAG